MASSATALYEKLGVFYLGKPFDLATNTLGTEPVLYDSQDLVTHAVIVGMTGSGKTGLGMSLIEEAAIDGVPVMAIDPKGDLGNLLLTFPEPGAPATSSRGSMPTKPRGSGITVDAFAAQEAATWKKGLAEWGQDGERIARLRDAADFAIYTPGSRAGRPVSILESFDAPSEAEREDSERMAEAVTTTATSVLTLLGVDADPVQSREHILLSAILNDAWRKGENLDLAALIHRIQQPPFTRVGVLDLEAFYPGEGSLRAGDARQRPAGRAELRAVARRRAARHRQDALHAGRQAARGDRLDRASVRLGADVLRDAAAQPRRQLDARAVGHVEPARDALHGRGRRLHAAGRQSAVEAGAAAADEAGARLRPRRGAGDAEPGRPRLQGPVERRHVVPRPAADRARQGAAARRARRRAAGAGRTRSIAARPSASCPRCRSARSSCTTCTRTRR